MAKYNFNQSVPTHILLAHLRRLLEMVDPKLRRATSGAEIAVLQGRALQLEELLHLPEQLTTIHDMEEAEDASKGK